jgi:transcriptional regulator with XRE-family HTH domain
MTASVVPSAEFSFDQRVGENFRRLRKRSRLSQHDVANAMTAIGTPMTQQSVTRVERGIRTLKFDEALAFAAVIRVPVSELAWGTARGGSVSVAWLVQPSQSQPSQPAQSVEELNERIMRLEADLERLARERVQPALV